MAPEGDEVGVAGVGEDEQGRSAGVSEERAAFLPGGGGGAALPKHELAIAGEEAEARVLLIESDFRAGGGGKRGKRLLAEGGLRLRPAGGIVIEVAGAECGICFKQNPRLAFSRKIAGRETSGEERALVAEGTRGSGQRTGEREKMSTSGHDSIKLTV